MADEIKDEAQPQAVPAEIEAYLHSLLAEKKADTLSGEIQGKLMYDLYERFNDYLLVNTAKAMPEDKKDEFDALIGSDATAQDIQKFIRDNTDYSKVVSETCDEFKQVFLSGK